MDHVKVPHSILGEKAGQGGHGSAQGPPRGGRGGGGGGENEKKNFKNRAFFASEASPKKIEFFDQKSPKIV